MHGWLTHTSGVARRAKFAATAVYDRALVAAGTAAGRLGRRLLLHIHRDEAVTAPAPVEFGGRRFDVGADLEEYTHLPRATIDALLRREHDSFRLEWHLAPDALRVDDWYYLSSSAYLFGNASHDPAPVVAVVEQHVGRTGQALEFGGGTANLALALAALGWSIDYLERSALQKDFVRFRVEKHGFEGRVSVLDDWRPLQRGRYDLVCALDVFEHVLHIESLLGKVVASIRTGGVLLESSPFVRNLSNPMHHEHAGFDELLIAKGLRLEHETPECRIWRNTNRED